MEAKCTWAMAAVLGLALLATAQGIDLRFSCLLAEDSCVPPLSSAELEWEELGTQLCPPEEVLVWSPDRPLRWEDFRGTPPPEAARCHQAAAIYYRLSFRYQAQVRLVSGRWRATIVPGSLQVTNEMLCCLSWVLPGHRTEAVLRHEQGHFDLNEVYRRILERRLAGLSGEGASPQLALHDLAQKLQATYDRVWQRARQVQAQYDQETDHHRDLRAQARWEEQIRRWLENPSLAPQP
jgi:hypothetical protein